MNSGGDTTLGGGDKVFPETTLGFSGGLRNPAAADYGRALETLCARYWKPVYSYLRIAWAKSRSACCWTVTLPAASQACSHRAADS